jgi:glycosyltransferase involved in cell wall biosynthesis
VYFSGEESQRKSDIDSWSRWISGRMNATRDIANKVDRFIAPSQYLRNRFIRDFSVPNRKITFLDYGFPIAHLHKPCRSKETREYTFGYIGTHIPAKGVNLLIQAFLNVKGDVKLKIFGRDNGLSTRALKKMSEQADGRIEFCGEYSNEDVSNKVFSVIDAIVVPSIWAENSPLVIHEAQECSIPVITADYGGMAEYVKNKVNGLLFRHRDIESLTNAMQWAVDHPADMVRFGKRGYLFSDDGHVHDIKTHCQKLMEIFANEMRK